MRTTFVEDLSPQGPVVALDQIDATIDALRRAVTSALWRWPRDGSSWLGFAEPGSCVGSEWLVTEIEASFAAMERLARAAMPPHRRALRVVREMRALLWAMLPIELYPAAGGQRREGGA